MIDSQDLGAMLVMLERGEETGSFYTNMINMCSLHMLSATHVQS